jgi:hypothetical protein
MGTEVKEPDLDNARVLALLNLSVNSSLTVLGLLLLEDHRHFSPLNSSAREAHDRTQLSSAITTSAVGVASNVRRKRYHQDEMIRLADFAGTSPRSSNTSPKPPPCNNRSIALNACSRLLAQRIQSNRSQFISARAADSGSNTLFVSTNAQTSSCFVAWARAESIKLVRPEDAGPKTSVMAPRRNPPKINESICGRPLEITSAGLFSCSLKADPKRDVISDSISAFENAALMFYKLTVVKQTIVCVRLHQAGVSSCSKLTVCFTKTDTCHAKLHQAQQKNSFPIN